MVGDAPPLDQVGRFLAAVSEAGWPPTVEHHRPPVVAVSWDPPMPNAVGARARELTGLRSAWPDHVDVTGCEDGDWDEGSWAGATLFPNGTFGTIDD